MGWPGVSLPEIKYPEIEIKQPCRHGDAGYVRAADVTIKGHVIPQSSLSNSATSSSI